MRVLALECCSRGSGRLAPCARDQRASVFAGVGGRLAPRPGHIGSLSSMCPLTPLVVSIAPGGWLEVLYLVLGESFHFLEGVWLGRRCLMVSLVSSFVMV